MHYRRPIAARISSSGSGFWSNHNQNTGVATEGRIAHGSLVQVPDPRFCSRLDHRCVGLLCPCRSSVLNRSRVCVQRTCNLAGVSPSHHRRPLCVPLHHTQMPNIEHRRRSKPFRCHSGQHRKLRIVPLRGSEPNPVHLSVRWSPPVLHVVPP